MVVVWYTSKEFSEPPLLSVLHNVIHNKELIYKQEHLREHLHPPKNEIINKCKNLDYFFFYPDSDPDDSQNLMESKLDQEPSPDISQEDPTSSVCIILLTNRQTNKWS